MDVLLVSLFQFFCGLLTLFIASNALLASADKAIVRFHLPPLFIGSTLIAIGTSLPEICVSFQSVYMGEPDVAFANIIGSNLVNASFVLGVCMFLQTIPFSKNLFLKQLLPNCFITLIVLIAVWSGGVLSRVAGFVLVTFFIVYLHFCYKHKANDESKASKHFFKPTIFNIMMLFLVSLPLFYFGSRFVTIGALEIAKQLSINSAFVGFTLIAFGTSLPEFITGVLAALRKQNNFVIGNVFGSNSCNMGLGLGLVALWMPLKSNDCIYLRKELSFLLMLSALLCCCAKLRHWGKLLGTLLAGLYMVVIYMLYAMKA